MLLWLVFTTFWVIGSLFVYFLLLVVLTAAWQLYRVPIARTWSRSTVRPNQAILITGATSGIGLAVTKHLYKLGYTVIAGYFDAKEPGYHELEKLGKRDGEHGQKLILEDIDVTSVTSVSAAYERICPILTSHNLELFALINNAGLGSLQPIAWLQRRRIVDLINTNLLGALYMTREFLPLLVQTNRGIRHSSTKPRIINVSSGLGFLPGATYITYGATKSSLLYLTKSLNLELEEDYGVKSIAVVPHNFIKNTNIGSTNVRQNKLAWDDLKPLEQELYRDKFEKHCKLTECLELATERYKVSAGNGGKSQKQKSSHINVSIAKLLQLWQALQDSFRGESSSLTLEQSGILECFEDAIRLKDPPETMFAGDNIFSYIVGPVLLSLPASCTSLLGPYVSPSLYR